MTSPSLFRKRSSHFGNEVLTFLFFYLLPHLFNELLCFRGFLSFFFFLLFILLFFFVLIFRFFLGFRWLCTLLLLFLSIFLFLVLLLFLVKDDLFLSLKQVNQWSAKNILVKQIEFLFLFQSECDVLWLQIGMNKLADSVHIIKSHQ